MVQVNNAAVENNFSGGFKTESTGFLNFPQNAVTETDNSVYTLLGNVLRRDGFDLEANYVQQAMGGSSTGVAVTTYRWLNAGGDGSSQILVCQIGSTVYFFVSTNATTASPLSTTKLATSINLITYQVSGGADPTGLHCNYADGNGYLFIFNAGCDPVAVTYTAGAVAGSAITVQIRDQYGIPEPGVAWNFRPSVLTAEHNYNLINQGWSLGWVGNIAVGGVTTYTNSGTFTYVLDSSTLPITVGGVVQIMINPTSAFDPVPYMTGNVVSYIGNQLTVTITAKSSGSPGALTAFYPWTVSPYPNNITVWHDGDTTTTPDSTALNNYPSNSDIWWQFKYVNVNSAAPTGEFIPSKTLYTVTLDNAPAARGSIIFNAFNMDRSTASYITGLTTQSTVARPTCGCWHAGRLFMSGVNSNFAASGDIGFYTWSENIYFSQIIQTPSQFGYCYQQNDPTSENFFDLLPDDGGVITIYGSGTIYEVFPVVNGIIVRAANGVWFITGNQGIGFTATDYAITKISGVESNSLMPSVNVQGWPYFWNAEGIYEVKPPAEGGGGLMVEPITLGTILSYYNEIPLLSKQYARGAYDPIGYTIQWGFSSTNPADIRSRTAYDKFLIYNTANKAFYIYTLPTSPAIHSVTFIQSPGGSTAPDPTFKYLVNISDGNWSFAEERDPLFRDWHSISDVDYTSTFTTGYRLEGKGLTKFQNPYLILYNDTNDYAYYVQGVWNYSTSGDQTSKWTQTQLIEGDLTNYSRGFNRIKIRGRGNILQYKVTSKSGEPFDIAGWSIFEAINQSP